MSGYQGYNQSEYTGGGFTTNANDSSQNQKTTTRSDQITPCTIKQITDSQPGENEGVYQINNVSLSLVSLVGIVRGVGENASNLLVKIEDGTGSLEFRVWINDNVADRDEFDDGDKEMTNSEQRNVPMGKYVRVTGSLREFNQTKSLQHPHIQVIEDYNQVLYHYLQVVKVHVESQGVVQSTTKNGDNNLFASNPAEEEQTLAGRVLELIKQNTPLMTDGVSLQFIHQRLGGDLGTLKECCSNLEDMAKIYLGVEEDAYLAV